MSSEILVGQKKHSLEVTSSDGGSWATQEPLFAFCLGCFFADSILFISGEFISK
jgi:protein associated with RNAse G/E